MKKERKHRFRFIKAVSLAILFGFLVGGGTSGALLYRSYLKTQKAEKAREITKQKEQDEKLATNLSGTPEPETNGNEISVLDVSTVWKNMLPAVVEVSTKTVSSYRFFGRDYEQESEGRGTGIVIASGEELFIVTNHHVINGATDIKVKFSDGTEAKAELKGTNAKKDVAVLGIDFSEISEETQKNIRVATIGDSNALQCGEMVIAIGNANGEGQSLTVGYVSAVDRKIDFEEASMKLIQTDAAINPGNSGGPLINSKGELIGINNAKLVDTNVEGIGYAIPVSEVVSEINLLINREAVSLSRSASLGIKELRDVTTGLSEILNIPVGVYIMEYSDDSAMEKAGIPIYSVITKVNGISVETEDDLMEALSYIRGGTEGTITVEERVQGSYEAKDYKVIFGTRKNQKQP